MYKSGFKIIETSKNVSLPKDTETIIYSRTGLCKLHQAYLVFETDYVTVSLIVDGNTIIDNISRVDLADTGVYAMPESDTSSLLRNSIIKIRGDSVLVFDFGEEGIAVSESFQIKATCSKTNKKFQAGLISVTGGQ